MGSTLGIMLTSTTYGTWLRGDKRGWVDDGRILPPLPWLEANDRTRMKHEPYMFDADRLHEIGQMIGESLIARKSAAILALHVARWHMHIVIGCTCHDVSEIAKCAKDAVRYGLRVGRPIWTADYDKRFCFDGRSLRARIRYVERHNEAAGWPARPWKFLLDANEYLASLHPARKPI
jgi:hypothetical protein